MADYTPLGPSVFGPDTCIVWSSSLSWEPLFSLMDSHSVQDQTPLLTNRDAGKRKHINKPEGWLGNHPDQLLPHTHRWSQGALGSHASSDPWDSGGSGNALRERQGNEAKVRTPTFSSKTGSSQEGVRGTHSNRSPSPQYQDFRIHCSSLVPATKEAGETFTEVSELPVRYNSFKFKPYLHLIKTKSMQVILWQSVPEIDRIIKS